MPNFKTEETRSTDRRRFIPGGIGLAVGTAAIPMTSPIAEAHFPPQLDIDVEPGSDTNPIITGSGGYVLVAVLSTEAFDPANKAVRYRFDTPEVIDSGSGARPAFGGNIVDVDDDGTDDLLLHFPVSETGFADCKRADQIAKLVWERDESGEHGYSGIDDVAVGTFKPTQRSQTMSGSDKNDETVDDGAEAGNSNGRSKQAKDGC